MNKSEIIIGQGAEKRPFKQGGPLARLFNTLMGKRVPTEAQPPYENYYSRGQNPSTNFYADYAPNPYRLHAPPVPLLPEDTVMKQDESASYVQRVPDQPLQTYFNQKKPVPVDPVMVPAHGVFVPQIIWKTGWHQRHIPDDALQFQRGDLTASSPTIQIGTERFANQPTYMDIGARAPIVGKAPKVR